MIKVIIFILSSKYAQGGLVGLIVGYYIGSLWVGKDQDEMMRQMTAALMLVRGIN